MSKRIGLECNHQVWMNTPLPKKGDLIYCVKCNTARHVGIGITRSAVEYYPDYDWKSIPQTPSGYRGECLIDGCEFFLFEKWDWYRLRNKMGTHNLRVHSGTPLLTYAEIVPIPTANTLTEPPF